MSLNNKWLTYWKKSLQYADIKPIDLVNEPLLFNNFDHIEQVSPSLVSKLWKQAQAPKDDTSIEIALCPAQSKITVEEQLIDDESECLYWIIVKMDKDGKLFVSPDDKPNPTPFFVRDYLKPNPEGSTTLSNVDTVDKVLSTYKFDSKTWQQHWLDCEAVFKTVTGKNYKDFNVFNKCQVYVEVAPLRGVSGNILTLYSELLKEPLSKNSPANKLKLLSNLIKDKQPSKIAYPDRQKVLVNKAHLGQFSGQFPLAGSQRVSMRGFTDSLEGEVVAVNGPPGTGKTTLLQSIVANLTVQHVLDNKPPALILASSTNNQAITNILTGFVLPDDDDLLTKRWLPEIPSLGLYMSGKNSKDYLMYDLKSSRTTGFFSDYENRSVDELQAEFISKSSEYLGASLASAIEGKQLLKQHIVKLQQQTINAIELAEKVASIDSDLCDKGFQSIDGLSNELSQKKEQLYKIDVLIERWGRSQQELHQAYDNQSFFAKLLRFLPRLKQRRASQFERIVSTIDGEALEVTDWSNHYHIIERIDQLLTKYNHEKHSIKAVVKTFDELAKEIKNKQQAWQIWLDIWNSDYQSKLSNLYKMTGSEYQKLEVLEDINIRLDISYRYEAFWLALHYREAEYIELLSARSGKTDAEFGKETYRSKLQRYACLTPIFISTFHSAPKFSQYFKPGAGGPLPHYELYDYLIVDEAGQVAPDVALPTFALAKTALIVGDSKQIEPVSSVSLPMDTVNYLHYYAEKSDGFDERVLASHKDQGKLSASGSLMLMAQHANIYQQRVKTKTITTGNQESESAITGSRVKAGASLSKSDLYKDNLFEDGINGLLLTEHRRCLDQLISYSNDFIYNGQLEPKRGRQPAINLDFIKGNKGYVHVDYSSERHGKSRINKLEAYTIAAWIDTHSQTLIDLYDKPIHQIVAVVTPYKPQSLGIKKALKQYHSSFEKITVGTVHALQGAERPIVLFSLVASPQDGLSFLNRQYNLLNVTISRAKDYFVFFGNMNTLAMTSHTPLGNLRRWLLDNPDAEINNSFVYDLIGESLNSDIESKQSSDIYDHVLTTHVNDTEHHQAILEAAFQRADSELSIVSPFLSINVLSSTLQAKIQDAVVRGVIVTVYCDAALDNSKNVKRKPSSVQAINKLLSLGVVVKEIKGIHSKTIMFETSTGHVLIEGSFNWLSAVRDKNSPYNRYEASIILIGPKVASRIEEIKTFLKERSTEIGQQT